MIMTVVTIHSKIVMMTMMELTIETIIVHKDLFCGYLVPLPIKMETAVMIQLKTMIEIMTVFWIIWTNVRWDYPDGFQLR